MKCATYLTNGFLNIPLKAYICVNTVRLVLLRFINLICF